jgi:PEGA domain
MRQAIPATMILVLLAYALCVARDDKPREQPVAPGPQTNTGTLKLYPANNEVEGVLAHSIPTPRIVLDGEFVGDSSSLLFNTPAHFRLPAGKHRVRIEVQGYKPFESDIHLIGNDTNQYLCVAFEKQ